MIQSIKDAVSITGSLSRPGKMPGFAFGISASQCKTGSKLAQVPGSVCSKCYAKKGMYTFKVVKEAHAKRLEGIDHPNWVEAMVYVLKHQALKKSSFFRWHDSGDIQNVGHLRRIAMICEQIPEMHFWMPTREKKILREYQSMFGDLPSNLTVRLSSAMINEAPPEGFENTSAVSTTETSFGHRCPAPTQNNECGDCRACWDRRVKCVTYSYH